MDKSLIKSGLCRKIEGAFQQSPPPGLDRLIIPDGEDNPEAEELEEAIKDRTWKEAIPHIFSLSFPDATIFLKDEVRDYYLPSYLTYIVENNDGMYSNEFCAALDAILPRNANIFERYYKDLSASQIYLVIEILMFVDPHPETWADAIEQMQPLINSQKNSSGIQPNFHDSDKN